MDQFIICTLVISPECAPKGVLTDARTTLGTLMLSLSSQTRVTSQTSSRCCIFFNISLELSKNFPIYSNNLILFLLT